MGWSYNYGGYEQHVRMREGYRERERERETNE